MKKILILNGAARKNGATAGLIRAFTEGARSAGNEVEELYLYDLNVNDCIGCETCQKRGETDVPNPCVQQDDMVKVYDAFKKSEVVVFASPIYYWTITGKLKTVTDRLLAMIGALGMHGYWRSTALLCTAAGPNYELATKWHENFYHVTGWELLGNVLGAGKEEEAYALGASIH